MEAKENLILTSMQYCNLTAWGTRLVQCICISVVVVVEVVVVVYCYCLLLPFTGWLCCDIAS